MKPFMYILSHISDHLSMDLVQNPRCSLAKVQSINQSFYIHEHAITCVYCVSISVNSCNVQCSRVPFYIRKLNEIHIPVNKHRVTYPKP